MTTQIRTSFQNLTKNQTLIKTSRKHLMTEKIDLPDYEEKCQKILDEPEIRFAALLDEFGNVLTEGYKQEITPKLSEEKFQSICKELASRVAKRKVHDDEIGHVKYSASRRENVAIMSFPVYDKVVMIIVESHINIDRFAFRIIGILGRQWGEFFVE